MTLRSSDPRRYRIGTFVAPAALLSALGCGAPVFPKQLFTVEASEADFPVMLSKAPAKDGGRTIEASSGTHFAQSSSSYRAGNVQVHVTTTERGESEMPASDKFNAKVRRSDGWVQLEGAEYVADDFSGYGFSRADRNMSMQGKVHK